MKRILIIALCLLSFVSLTACGVKSAPYPDTPGLDKIVSGTISHNGNDYVLDNPFCEVFITNVNFMKYTNKGSVNDTPSVDDYYCIKICDNENNVYVYYVYENNYRYYLEQPYCRIGIVEDSLFNFVESSFILSMN